MSFAVGRIGKLARQENIVARGGELFAPANAAQKSPFGLRDRNNFGAVAANQVDALLAHPIRHEYLHRMAEHAAQSCEGNACIAAGGFRYVVAGSDRAILIGLLEY